MGLYKEIASCPSLLKFDKGNQQDSASIDYTVGYTKSDSPQALGFFKSDDLYQPFYDTDNDEANKSLPDGQVCNQFRSNPEINLKNVLGGIAAILTGQNKGNNDSNSLRSSTDLSFFSSEENGESFLHQSVCVPSAPPLLGVEPVSFGSYKDVLEAEPPEWLPDSSSAVCMQCSSPFTVLTRGRHHCRFCGRIFCRNCTKGRCLLPVKFRQRDPQRVCDACYDRLDPLQNILIYYVSNASQIAKHDVTDWTCTRGWLNLPVGLSMEYEIYKATNILRNYCQVARLEPEKHIPWAVLKDAQGLAILTVIKCGALLTYKAGTGLVVSRRADGTWSAPSAILSAGLGWGAQMGGELMDLIIVLRGSKAVKAFSSQMHFSFGAGLSAAAGPVGRVLEADLRASEKGSCMCYSYSCSKGAFIGVSLEGNFVSARMETNLRFYGDPYLTTTEILLGNVERPRAAKPLYHALDELYAKFQC